MWVHILVSVLLSSGSEGHQGEDVLGKKKKDEKGAGSAEDSSPFPLRSAFIRPKVGSHKLREQKAAAFVAEAQEHVSGSQPVWIGPRSLSSLSKQTSTCFLLKSLFKSPLALPPPPSSLFLLHLAFPATGQVCSHHFANPVQ